MKAKGQIWPTNLHILSHGNDQLNIYLLLLKFARKQWPALNIIGDFVTKPGLTIFHGSQSAHSFPFIYKDRVCYGCSTTS